MSLSDPDEDYNELVPAGAGKVNKFVKKSRFYILILVIGIVIGIYLQYAFLNPVFLAAQTNSCSDCIRSKDLLNKENTCLYTLLDNPLSASTHCSPQLLPEEIGPTPNPLPDTNMPDLNLPDSNDAGPELVDLNEPKGF